MTHLFCQISLLLQKVIEESCCEPKWHGSLEGARFTVYDDKREEVVTYVSRCGLQRQHIMANKGQRSS